MTTQRRSYETGHKPKCLVIVDDTAEWDRAVYYASRWAIRVGGGVVMLRVIETEDQNQQWLGVADIMRAEAHEAANEALDRASGRANGIAAITPERVIREGDPGEQILDVIDKDVDISMLVLAANPGPEGPGPIITTMAKTVGSFPIPLVVVPGGLTDEEIARMSVLLDDLKHVRTIEHHPAFSGQCTNEAPKHQRCRDIETRIRLVEHEDLRIVQEPGGQ